MTFDYTLPEWENEGTTPSDSLKQSGFTAGYKPPASVFNWFWAKVSKCISELQEKLNSLSSTYASTTQAGLIKLYSTAEGENQSGIVVGDDGAAYIGTATEKGLYRTASGEVVTAAATTAEIDEGANSYKPIVPSTAEYTVGKYAVKTITNTTDKVSTYNGGAGTLYYVLPSAANNMPNKEHGYLVNASDYYTVLSGGTSEWVLVALDLADGHTYYTKTSVDTSTTSVFTHAHKWTDMTEYVADGSVTETNLSEELQSKITDLIDRIAELETKVAGLGTICDITIECTFAEHPTGYEDATWGCTKYDISGSWNNGSTFSISIPYAEIENDLGARMYFVFNSDTDVEAQVIYCDTSGKYLGAPSENYVQLFTEVPTSSQTVTYTYKK